MNYIVHELHLNKSVFKKGLLIQSAIGGDMDDEGESVVTVQTKRIQPCVFKSLSRKGAITVSLEATPRGIFYIRNFHFKETNKRQVLNPWHDLI